MYSFSISSSGAAGYVLGPGDEAHARGERSLALPARVPAEVLLSDAGESLASSGTASF